MGDTIVTSRDQISVLITLGYVAQFSYGLTVAEIRQRSIGQKFSDTVIRAALAELAGLGLVTQSPAGYWYLTGVEQHRHQRAELSLELEKDLPLLQKTVGCLPWVRLLGVTGSLAMKNAEKTDDIDVMVITDPRRLWITRLFVVLIAEIMGKRRAWNADSKGETATAGSWCFNLWLTLDNLTTSLQHQTPYVAYEILQMRPIFQRGQVAAYFRWQNNWTRQLLPNQPVPRHTITWRRWPVWSELLDGLDWLAYMLQRWYMRSHMTTERVTRVVAFFHPRNTQQDIYRGWTQALQAKK